MNSTNAAASQAKRTRTNVKQSKYGCLMCKKRRVKCDEYKPSCKRCLSCKLTCTGYPRGAPAGPWLRSSSSAAVHPKSILKAGPSQPRTLHTHLACTLFVQGPRRAKSEAEITFWSQTVPQLIDALPSVRAAATAFGAAYEVHVLKRFSADTELGAVSKYCHALRLVQQDVSNLSNGAVSCMAACLLLAFTEVLQQRSYQAYFHVQGAAALIANRPSSDSRVLDEETSLALFEKLDLHSATYLQSRPTSVESRRPAHPLHMPKSPDRALYRVLRDSYHFSSSVWWYKYVHPDSIPPELLIEQGRHVMNLRGWLSSHPIKPSPPVDDPEAQQLLVLRAQCLAGLIRCSNVLTPYEGSYDHYDLEFEEIITLAKSSHDAQLKEAKSPNVSSINLPSFTPEMGIIQPLFYTVLKYRQPLWRRKALGLLLRSGREGPWCGAIEGTVLKAVIEAEESVALDSSTRRVDMTEKPAELSKAISEKDRIRVCLVVGYLDQQHNQIAWINGPQGSSPAFAQVQLSKCRDLDTLVSEHRMEGESSESPWMDARLWETWIETIKLPEHL